MRISTTTNKSLNFEVSKDNAVPAALWFAVALVATYLTTTSPEAQLSGRAWCTLLSPSHYAFSDYMAFGHCGWCYVAAASFGASILSLFKKA
jgi:hypothetical protein